MRRLFEEGNYADLAGELAELRAIRCSESRAVRDLILSQRDRASMLQAYIRARDEFAVTGHELEPEDEAQIVTILGCRSNSAGLPMPKHMGGAAYPPPRIGPATSAPATAAGLRHRVLRPIGWRLGGTVLRCMAVVAGILVVPVAMTVLTHVGLAWLASGRDHARAIAVLHTALLTQWFTVLTTWMIGFTYVAAPVLLVLLARSPAEDRVGTSIVVMIAFLGGHYLHRSHQLPYTVVRAPLAMEVLQGEETALAWASNTSRPVAEVTGLWIEQQQGQNLCLLREISWFGRLVKGRYYWPDCAEVDLYLRPEQRAQALNHTWDEIARRLRELPRQAP